MSKHKENHEQLVDSFFLLVGVIDLQDIDIYNYIYIYISRYHRISVAAVVNHISIVQPQVPI